MTTDVGGLMLRLIRDNPAIVADLLKRVRPDLVPNFSVARLEPDSVTDIRHIWDHEDPAKDGEYKSDFARGYFSEGKAEGKVENAAEMILSVLGARGIDVSAESRTRIEECADLERLMAWGRRAAVAESIEDVFG